MKLGINGAVALVLTGTFFWAARAAGQRGIMPRAADAPRLEAVAETRLLMQGLAQANFRGLERLLRQKPNSPDAWTFARGQALLIAETGNLLMLRPPRTDGRAAWLERAADLRMAATRLARAAGSQQYEPARVNLTRLAQSCNSCHRTFRVSVAVTAFGKSAETGPPTGPAVP